MRKIRLAEIDRLQQIEAENARLAAIQQAQAQEAERLRLAAIESDRIARLEIEAAQAAEVERLARERAQAEREAREIQAREEAEALRLSAFGKEDWSKQSVYSGQSASIVALRDGSIVVGGVLNGEGYMAGLSSLGAKQWERQPDAFRSITTLVPSKSNGYYAGGTHPRKFIAGKYDSDGQKVWKVKQPANGTFHEVVDFHELRDESVIIAGIEETAASETNLVFIGIDKEGNEAWREVAIAGFDGRFFGFMLENKDILAVFWDASGDLGVVDISPSTGQTQISSRSNFSETETSKFKVDEIGMFMISLPNDGLIEVDGTELSRKDEAAEKIWAKNLTSSIEDMSLVNGVDLLTIDDRFTVKLLSNVTGK